VAMVVIWVPARIRLAGTVLASCMAVILGLYLFRLSHKSGFAVFSNIVAAGYANQQWAALALETGIDDPATDLILYPDLPLLHRALPVMRRERLSLFADPEVWWIGRDVKTVFPGGLQRQTAQGEMVASQRLASAIAVAGWTSVSSSVFHHLELVLVDGNGRIVGLGERLPAGLPKYFAGLKIRPDEQWSGFINLAYGSRKVSAYVVTRDRKALIPIAGEMDVEAAK